METLEAIKTRRSIRTYTSQPVTESQADQLLRAAMKAPSASNQQPWQFIVMDDRETLNSLAAVLPYGQMLSEAPLGIAVCGDLSREKSKGYWVQDCSAATQNLLLAAHDLNLGAVWIGVHPRQDRVAGVQKLLQLPDYVIPLCVVAVGYPGEKKLPIDRFDPSRIHKNSW